MKNKIVTLVLSLCLILTFLPSNVSATEPNSKNSVESLNNTEDTENKDNTESQNNTESLNNAENTESLANTENQKDTDNKNNLENTESQQNTESQRITGNPNNTNYGSRANPVFTAILTLNSEAYHDANVELINENDPSLKYPMPEDTAATGTYSTNVGLGTYLLYINGVQVDKYYITAGTISGTTRYRYFTVDYMGNDHTFTAGSKPAQQIVKSGNLATIPATPRTDDIPTR